MIRRRDFLKRTLAASALPLVAVRTPGGARALAGPVPEGGRRTLVVLELTGGNDGLNTVVPYADDRYHRARPGLRLSPGAVHRLDDHTALAPALEGLAERFREGGLAVVQGVGMPEPDRSHFISLARWHGGDPTGRARDGWLGRALDRLPGGPGPLPGLALGTGDLPALFAGTTSPATACRTLAELVPERSVRERLVAPDALALERLWASPDERALARAGRGLLTRLEGVLAADAPRAGLPGDALGRALSDALRLLGSDLHVPALFLGLGGFDTHARQPQVQPALLRLLDRALVPFTTFLDRAGRSRDVLVLVYSEFGRRVAENGSRGTDHGSAGPAFLLGGGLPGGLHGDRPDLAALDEGDVRATVDFRRLLATGLAHLGHPDPRQVLGPEGRPLLSPVR